MTRIVTTGRNSWHHTPGYRYESPQHARLDRDDPWLWPFLRQFAALALVVGVAWVACVMVPW